MLSNSDLIHRLAAPIPLDFDMVSLNVCRVPKPTNVRISFSILSEDTLSMISYKS